MRAIRYDGAAVGLVRIPSPVPGPEEVLLDVAAAGLCHSDVILMSRASASHPFPLPLVLGHEIAGRSGGVDYVVYGPWGCGSCPQCRSGAENLCPVARAGGLLPPGLGSPGGLADQVVVPARHLVNACGIDPVQAAPLTDAGTTAVAAVRAAVPAGTRADAVVGVVGAGGLGHLAIQVLHATSEVRVVVLDRSADARRIATDLGAVATVDVADFVGTIADLTGGEGATAVLDFVATGATLSAAASVLAPGGHLGVVGVGSDALMVSVPSMPLGATVQLTYWGTRDDLDTALDLARRGLLRVHTQEIALEEVPAMYSLLQGGRVTGRAVAVLGAAG